MVHHVNQALKANLLFNKDTDYIIRDGKVQIIDEFTGRVLDGRRFSDGLHQAIEAKENVKVEEENQTLASITYQNYFRLYKKLAGMTGTAMTEAEEFYDIYKLNVVSIPTNKNMLRKDFNDQIYRTETEKYNAITNKIIECNNKGQPVLVGTTSIEKSEKISKNFLNLKNKIKYTKNINQFLQKTKKDFERLFNIKIEYLENRNTNDLSLSSKYNRSKIFLAYYYKDVRLIDNF